MAKHIGLDGKVSTPLEVIFEPEGGDMKAPVVIVSKPPPGAHRICNMYMTADGKLVIEHSDIEA